MRRPPSLASRRAILPVALAALAAAACGEARQRAGADLTQPIGGSLCTTCHGDARRATNSAAPPRSVKGNTAPTEQGVGAHQVHLSGSGIAAAIPCTTCHVVPDPDGNWQSHITGRATLTFTGVAVSDGARASYDSGTDTCSNVYCHGATVGGGSTPTPKWTEPWNVDFAQPASAAVCGKCHGFPPPPPHPAATKCGACHSKTVNADGTINVAGGRHVDGEKPGNECGSCHDVPPASGAHRRHYGDATDKPLATYGDLRTLEGYGVGAKGYYVFGCGNCHPVDAAKHGNGQIDVELADQGAPRGSLKARNAASAAYDRGAGTCSGVYCHSSGQQAPAYQTTPSWRDGKITTCDACHANPPNYRSNPATGAANTHLVVGDDGALHGHFGSINKVTGGHDDTHGTRPGVTDATAITCQTCHYATVDPANTGPSNFYYLDTSGTYAATGSNGQPVAVANACTRCHNQSGAASRGGRIQPMKHVNGSRDVVFDPRTSAPDIAYLPAGPNRPTRPYWITRANTAVVGAIPESAVNGSTWSFSLSGARYVSDPAAPGYRTCSSVACHLTATPAWGSPIGNGSTCTRCHAF